ncbi:hypothetical protein WOC76_17025 [Methylocystis sp. IM3]|uniref:hypothetical protein n=1 Tax=Methylocystis sp. IM3 TaxID=3136722 RepID=UPI000F909B97|nr:MAG: hypothetical protein EKK29_06515 [Hyphomicrobiales bacterium]
MRRDHNFSPLMMRRPSHGLSPRGQELDSLAEANLLQGRFFSWRGVSGRRYVCSIFQRGEEGFVSEVESAVVVGVAREGLARRPLCVFSTREPGARPPLASLAHELGVSEWHVHFCAGDETARDLSGSLLN